VTVFWRYMSDMQARYWKQYVDRLLTAACNGLALIDSFSFCNTRTDVYSDAECSTTEHESTHRYVYLRLSVVLSIVFLMLEKLAMNGIVYLSGFLRVCLLDLRGIASEIHGMLRSEHISFSKQWLSTFSHKHVCMPFAFQSGHIVLSMLSLLGFATNAFSLVRWSLDLLKFYTTEVLHPYQYGNIEAVKIQAGVY